MPCDTRHFTLFFDFLLSSFHLLHGHYLAHGFSMPSLLPSKENNIALAVFSKF